MPQISNKHKILVLSIQFHKKKGSHCIPDIEI